MSKVKLKFPKSTSRDIAEDLRAIREALDMTPGSSVEKTRIISRKRAPAMPVNDEPRENVSPILSNSRKSPPQVDEITRNRSSGRPVRQKKPNRRYTDISVESNTKRRQSKMSENGVSDEEYECDEAQSPKKPVNSRRYSKSPVKRAKLSKVVPNKQSKVSKPNTLVTLNKRARNSSSQRTQYSTEDTASHGGFIAPPEFEDEPEVDSDDSRAYDQTISYNYGEHSDENPETDDDQGQEDEQDMEYDSDDENLLKIRPTIHDDEDDERKPRKRRGRPTKGPKDDSPSPKNGLSASIGSKREGRGKRSLGAPRRVLEAAAKAAADAQLQAAGHRLSNLSDFADLLAGQHGSHQSQFVIPLDYNPTSMEYNQPPTSLDLPPDPLTSAPPDTSVPPPEDDAPALVYGPGPRTLTYNGEFYPLAPVVFKRRPGKFPRPRSHRYKPFSDGYKAPDVSHYREKYKRLLAARRGVRGQKRTTATPITFRGRTRQQSFLQSGMFPNVIGSPADSRWSYEHLLQLDETKDAIDALRMSSSLGEDFYDDSFSREARWGNTDPLSTSLSPTLGLQRARRVIRRRGGLAHSLRGLQRSPVKYRDDALARGVYADLTDEITSPSAYESSRMSYSGMRRSYREPSDFELSLGDVSGVGSTRHSGLIVGGLSKSGGMSKVDDATPASEIAGDHCYMKPRGGVTLDTNDGTEHLSLLGNSSTSRLELGSGSHFIQLAGDFNPSVNTSSFSGESTSILAFGSTASTSDEKARYSMPSTLRVSLSSTPRMNSNADTHVVNRRAVPFMVEQGEIVNGDVGF